MCQSQQKSQPRNNRAIGRFACFNLQQPTTATGQELTATVSVCSIRPMGSHLLRERNRPLYLNLPGVLPVSIWWNIRRMDIVWCNCRANEFCGPRSDVGTFRQRTNRLAGGYLGRFAAVLPVEHELAFAYNVLQTRSTSSLFCLDLH